jgi:hypothetical protein
MDTSKAPIKKQSKLLQFDDFAPDAFDVRRAVIDGPFGTVTGPDGASYTGISQYSVPHWIPLLEATIGADITPRLSGFRLNLAGELPHSWVHSDGICAAYASVLYLNLPSQYSGGTAFWRHIGLNIDHLPSKETLQAQGIHADWFYEMMTREWKDLTYWRQVGFVPMQFNRFITYPTNLFHSRYPFEGFGTGPADGRLIWVCFYDRKGEA